MNQDQIMEIIPHRAPMLLIDEASLGDDGKAYGHYTVRGDEWFLQGHFPGRPVVPGVIQCEMLAQTCCVLLSDHLAGKTPFFVGIDKARFKGQVFPGDKIEFICGVRKAKAPFYFAEGAGYVKGKLCMRAEVSFAVI